MQNGELERGSNPEVTRFGVPASIDDKAVCILSSQLSSRPHSKFDMRNAQPYAADLKPMETTTAQNLKKEKKMDIPF